MDGVSGSEYNSTLPTDSHALSYHDKGVSAAEDAEGTSSNSADKEIQPAPWERYGQHYK